MTWTGAFGRACRVLLHAIVRGLSLTRISPNVLTFLGLVINTIAHVLGVVESLDTPLAALTQAALRDKQLLLVLDNFEHLLTAAPRPVLRIGTLRSAGRRWSGAT